MLDIQNMQVDKSSDLGEQAQTRVLLGTPDCPIACYALYKRFKQGLGVPADPDKADVWLERAAELGSVDAKHEVAFRVWRGTRCVRDVQRAARMFKHLADGGHAEAACNYAQICEDSENYLDAAAYYKSAALAGFSAGAVNLGCMHETGQGFDVDVDAALHWYLHAAQAGNPFGMFNASTILKKRGDDESAMRWAAAGAAAGDTDCEYLVALYTQLGCGCVRDEAAAVAEFKRLADDHDCSYAAYKYAAAAREAGDMVSTVAYLEKAVAHKHRDAMIELAYLYDNDDPSDTHAPRVLQLYKGAAALGSNTGAFNAGLCLRDARAPASELIHYFEQCAAGDVEAAAELAGVLAGSYDQHVRDAGRAAELFKHVVRTGGRDEVGVACRYAKYSTPAVARAVYDALQSRQDLLRTPDMNAHMSDLANVCNNQFGLSSTKLHQVCVRPDNPGTTGSTQFVLTTDGTRKSVSLGQILSACT